MRYSQSKPNDSSAGIQISDDVERFAQRNDVFSRAFWDNSPRRPRTDAFFASYRTEATPRSGDGFAQRDFALRNAIWGILLSVQ